MIRKKLLTSYGEINELCKLFPYNGKPVSRRTMYNILNYKNNSELAEQVRKYVAVAWKRKPVILPA